MVRGITNFKKRFQGYEEQYVIIGGTACDLIMENEMTDLKSIGVSGLSKMQILNRLYRCYEIQRKDIILTDN